MTPEQIADRKDRIEYRVFMALNITILVIALALAIAFIVNVFKANWSYAVGFAILTYGVWWIFRRVPWPVTAAERRRREIVGMMNEFSRYR